MSLRFYFSFFSALFLFFAAPLLRADAPVALVSVAPHKFFVERIAGDTVAVELLVPAGASAHTFEPSPKQMLRASRATIWFKIGESFEKKALTTLRNYNPQLKESDLREGLDLIAENGSEGHCCSSHADCLDPHFWLSPRLAKRQAKTIARALIDVYPQNTSLYEKNLSAFEKELDALDSDIRALLQKPHNSVILVSHPAYAYYCRDYGFTQLSIEMEGKDPAPRQLTELLKKAKEANARHIFVQPQYSAKGAHLIARQLNADVISLDPYSENYIESLLYITKSFTSS